MHSLSQANKIRSRKWNRFWLLTPPSKVIKQKLYHILAAGYPKNRRKHRACATQSLMIFKLSLTSTTLASLLPMVYLLLKFKQIKLISEKKKFKLFSSHCKSCWGKTLSNNIFKMLHFGMPLIYAVRALLLCIRNFHTYR